MALSDCDKCWQTPCECGHEYESWSSDRITGLISVLKKTLIKRKMSDSSSFKKIPGGFEVKAGDFVEVEGGGIYEATDANYFEPELKSWTSIRFLRNGEPEYHFTHKGGIRKL